MLDCDDSDSITDKNTFTIFTCDQIYLLNTYTSTTTIILSVSTILEGEEKERERVPNMDAMDAMDATVMKCKQCHI